jgi:hypothetical protein
MRYLYKVKKTIKKIIREYLEKDSKSNDFKGFVDYAQEKAIETSNYPKETEKVDKMKDRIKKKVEKAYKDVTGEEPVSDDNIVVKVDGNIKKGKIGSFKHPDNKNDIGLMKIHPKALGDTDYVEDIIKHELIHASHGLEDEEARNHGGVFQKVADRVGLPKKYRH